MSPNTNPVAKRHSYGLREMHNYYKKECIREGRVVSLPTYNDFRDILITLFTEMMRVILTEARQITLPSKLGTFYVKKSKPKDISLWLERMSTKTKIAYLAGVKDGSSRRFYWSKALCNLPNKSVYAFKLTPYWQSKIKKYKE